ncbi:unnamed protein product [Lymnaea stagnalis]|uniref:Uncharacterized protein n=1 Tax=Lymnaea stagnalis TaxID=6523 RepID=A0AAV2IKY4_LYMST
MDSRLIAGAYSTATTFHTMELEQLSESNRFDSIARARKLSQDTNKRRKVQAHKRKLEAKREERRRQEILTKRREEQKLATEKYQRSHIPPSARQGSGRYSPRRQGPALDDALCLIRGNQHDDRPRSGRDRMLSPRDENHDPMERSYFENVWHHPVLSPPSRSTHPKDPSVRAELMDSSMQNFTSSKTLFEQQLEQQQNLLLEKQQTALREFDRAIRKEIDKDETTLGIIHDGNNQTIPTDDDNESCSSLDSLEGFKEGMTELKGRSNMTIQTGDRLSKGDQSGSTEFHFQPEQMYTASQSSFFTDAYRQTSDLNNLPVYDAMMNKSETNKSGPLATANFAQHPRPKNELSYVGVTRKNILKDRNNKEEYHVDQTLHAPPGVQASPLKQFSTDSLESVSTISSPSLSSANGATYGMSPEDEMLQAKLNTGYRLQQQNRMENNLVWVSPPHSDYSTKQSTVTSDGGSFQPRYSSLIGSSLLPGPSPQSQPSYFLNNTNQFTSNRSNTSETFSPVKIAPTVDISVNSNLQNNSSLKSVNAIGAKPSTQGPSLNNSNSINELAPVSKQGAQYFQATDQQNFPTHQSSLPKQIQASTGNMQPANVIKNPAMKSDVDNTQNALVYENKNTTSWIQGKSSHQHIDQNTSVQTHLSGPLSQEIITAPAPSLRSNNLSYVKSDLLLKGLTENVLLGMPSNSAGAGNIMENKNEPTFDARVNMAREHRGRAGEERGNDEPLEVRPVRGILKQSPVNYQLEAGECHDLPERQHPRDSLEITRLQTQKKANKKSVRFADHRLEETEYDSNGPEMLINSGGYLNKTMPTRPFSAKVFSGALKTENVVKVQRAASAGVTRPSLDDSSAQIQIRNVQQMYTGSPPFNPHENTNTNSFNSRSNLPPSFTTPLNTTLPANNRPRAAAHIIMSSEVHPPVKSTANEHENGFVPLNPASVGSTAHKSQLEMKVKAINNNFMTKVPVKIPNTTNINVYHAAYSGKELDQNSTKSNQGNQNSAEGNSQILQKEEQQQQNYDRSRIRDTTARRVAISNQTVTQTSIVPASTKMTYPQSNSAVPSYSNVTNNAPAQVYDENGLRIDRTPTDEEITWLWDKVRNCLQREDSSSKSQITGPSTESMHRPPPYLSTKLIDGASLGFGTSPGMNGIRSGSGFFHPHSSPSVNTQNKAKPVPLQQGSYLKRFGLLKQRRTNSASAVGSAAVNPNPRSNSAVYNRHQTVFPPQPTSSNGQPQQQHEGPIPIAFAYKPQDEVSESTAAFLMAERLAKQSLTESHIQIAMEDAQNKQEAHNRSKMMAARGGHSALSIEEQRLMESLDKLNERLKAVEPGKTNGTIHYHQAYQAQLSGFRSQTAINDGRRLTATSPRTQQRSQSARIRQQTRQYR